MKVKDLKKKSSFDELTLKVVSKGEVRKFVSDDRAGQVCNLAAEDSEGDEISVTLWNKQCSQVNEGDKIKISNGWCTEYQSRLQVSTGRGGKLEVLEE